MLDAIRALLQDNPKVERVLEVAKKTSCWSLPGKTTHSTTGRPWDDLLFCDEAGYCSSRFRESAGEAALARLQPHPGSDVTARSRSAGDGSTDKSHYRQFAG